jgi:hypothetical protein
LVVSRVVGKRTAEATHALVRDVHRRTGGRVMRRITSDEYPAYPGAIRAAYGQVVTPPRTGRPGRPRNPYVVVPPGVTYATVRKHRGNTRVVRGTTRVVCGTLVAVARALAVSAVRRAVHTCVVERHHGTDRDRCRRKVRKAGGLSKDWAVHRAAAPFGHFSYNFCWPARTLRVKVGGRWRARTPARAAGLTDHVWSLSEWLAYPAVQRK